MEPTINITAMEALKDGMVNYEITLNLPGQKPLDLRLSVRGNDVSVETMEALRLADEMYGPEGLGNVW